jgi:type II restriction enzyme
LTADKGLGNSLVRSDILGFKDENSYINYFFASLLKTNWTYDYFVEWEKVRKNIRYLVKEISILNSLSKMPSSERRNELKTIFTKYPETVPIIPLIIATREKTIPILEVGSKGKESVFNFNLKGINETEATNLVHFCEKVGILALFNEINDLYAYLLGVEVGLDSNARKNRSGNIFSQLLGLLLRSKVQKYGLQLSEEDSSIQIERSKRADFVISAKGKPIIAIECNFYNSTGSKPIEVANAYIDLQRKVRAKGNLTFVWITDGPAWVKMNSAIRQCFREIDFPINYAIANEKFEEILNFALGK